MLPMEALKAYSSLSLSFITKRVPFETKIFNKPIFLHHPLGYHDQRRANLDIPSLQFKKAKFQVSSTVTPSTVSTDHDHQEINKIRNEKKDEKFDWYAHWYPVMPVCDLDKKRPFGIKVIGMDIVVWWDKNENEWKVFEDLCPHRLVPLSEGRIDPWGRLQCAYHGWCFDGSGACKLIPQAHRDGPPIHTSRKACVAVYPSCVQNSILWFWPNSDHQYADILSREKPPYIPEMDDPSYTNSLYARDLDYGYEVMIQNVMDPTHVPYAHKGLLPSFEAPKSVKLDREGGEPMDTTLTAFGKNGFTAKSYDGHFQKFFAPCLFYNTLFSEAESSSAGTTENPSRTKPQDRDRIVRLAFFCIPVSPGKSRFIFAQPRNFAVWVDRVVPRWVIHVMMHNPILDSDLYFVHSEERKIEEIGSLDWNKTCFLPTKSDTLVVAARRWLNEYSNGKVDWGKRFSGALPPSPPREQLMDKYWNHTMKCSSCSQAYKGLNALEIVLQIFSIASIGIVAAKHSAISIASRNTLLATSILLFLASKWLSRFVYKHFRVHDYDHAFV